MNETKEAPFIKCSHCDNIDTNDHQYNCPLNGLPLFIVRAVRAHADLLDALKTVRTDCVLSMRTGWNLDMDGETTTDMSATDALDRLERFIDRTIAEAEGR